MAADVGIDRSPISNGTTVVVVVFIALALYNVIELTLIIWWVFKRRSGTYFWSFIVATYGIASYAVGFLLKYIRPEHNTIFYFYLVLIALGWTCMVTGQSLVLWSRLHLLLRDEFKLRLVLGMIIVDAVAMHLPIIILLFGSNSNSIDSSRFIRVYSIYEKIQVTVFFVQEVIISAIYIYETTKLRRVLSIMRKRRSRQLMHHLIYVNIIIIILDIGILSLEYAGQYSVQTSFKALVYGAKLKMEFAILNRLVEITTGDKESSSTEPTAYERRRQASYPLSSLGQQSAAPAPAVPATQSPHHPWAPWQPQPRPHQHTAGLSEVSYEVHAYSRSDSQTELATQGSPSASADVDNVYRTTEIVVMHEPRGAVSMSSSKEEAEGADHRISEV